MRQRLGGRVVARPPGRPQQEVVFPTRDQYVAVVGELPRRAASRCVPTCAASTT